MKTVCSKRFVASILCGVGIATLTAGCAPMLSGAMNLSVNENMLVEKTAKYFGVPSKDIAIVSIDKGALSTSYRTQLAKKLFDCSIYYGEISCKQIGA